jgi:hypothetical protein
MKHVICILVILLGINAFAVREVQNGGAGVTSEQRMETFLTANFRLNGNPEELQKIPGLIELMKELEGMPLKDSMKGRIFTALFPTADRQYFRIKKEDMSRATRDQLIDQFANIMQVPRSKVVLFAASAPSTQTTVLLEEFYKLKINEQKAMLLHEALWIMNPNLQYQQVIAIEQEAQAYFQDHKNLKAFYNFVNLLGEAVADKSLILSSMLQMDFMSGAFKSSAEGGSYIRLVDLLGEKYLDCMLLHDFTAHKSKFGAIDYVKSCTQALAYTMSMKVMANPNSLFYQAVLVYVGRYGLVDLLGPSGKDGRMAYFGAPVSYVNYRNSLWVRVEDQIGGVFMDLNVFESSGVAVGVIRF